LGQGKEKRRRGTSKKRGQGVGESCHLVLEKANYKVGEREETSGGSGGNGKGNAMPGEFSQGCRKTLPREVQDAGRGIKVRLQGPGRRKNMAKRRAQFFTRGGKKKSMCQNRKIYQNNGRWEGETGSFRVGRTKRNQLQSKRISWGVKDKEWFYGVRSGKKEKN